MEKFNPVTEPMEMDFFSIEPDFEGGKQIHIMGYLYQSDGDKVTPWRNCEACFCIEPLDEFVAHLADDEYHVDELFGECKQYIGDITEKEAIEVINHYFDGRPASHRLAYSEITMDTPCGHYVCF